MDLGILANQGTGWALFVFTAGIAGYLGRLLLAEKDKRADNIKDIGEKSYIAVNNLINAVNILNSGVGGSQKSQDEIIRLLQDIRGRLQR